jgi:hypothetical protein
LITYATAASRAARTPSGITALSGLAVGGSGVGNSEGIGTAVGVLRPHAERNTNNISKIEENAVLPHEFFISRLQKL